MRIDQLENCPAWLKEAHTENADVSITEYWVTWNSGDFCGGNFSGNFRGGNFRSGNFFGGNFCGGNFRGGNFFGGNFCGGNFRGGNFLGGNFRGGNFFGGNFCGGNFRGGNIVTELGRFKPRRIFTVISAVEGWPKTLVDLDGVAYILAGCRWFTLADARKHWKERSDRTLTYALLEGAAAVAKLWGLTESVAVPAAKEGK